MVRRRQEYEIVGDYVGGQRVRLKIGIKGD